MGRLLIAKRLQFVAIRESRIWRALAMDTQMTDLNG